MAFEELARAYWKPIYCFLRTAGLRNEDAKDRVQGFFGELLERRVLADYDPGKGKLRTFLLSCLKAHLGHERERAAALKRGAGVVHVPLDAEGEPPSGTLALEEGPESAFERAWAFAQLEQAIARVREELRRKGDAAAVVVFDLYLASENLARPRYAELSARSGRTENQVRHLLHDLRALLRGTLLEEIRAEVGNAQDAHAELQEFLATIGPR